MQVSVAEIPGMKCSFSEQPLAPGMPRMIDVQVSFKQPGEWAGLIRIEVCETFLPGASVESHDVPIYACCKGRTEFGRKISRTPRGKRITCLGLMNLN